MADVAHEFRLRKLTQRVSHASCKDPDLPLRLAEDYLKALGIILLGYVWCKTMRLALRLDVSDPNEFYKSKLTTGLFYFSYVAPTLDVHLPLIATALNADALASNESLMVDGFVDDEGR